MFNFIRRLIGKKPVYRVKAWNKEHYQWFDGEWYTITIVDNTPKNSWTRPDPINEAIMATLYSA